MAAWEHAGRNRRLRVVTRAGVTAGQVWAQRAVPDGDELAAALARLEAFPLEGKVISADTGLLRPPFVQKVVEQKGVAHRGRCFGKPLRAISLLMQESR